MGIDQQIAEIVERAVKAALEGLEMPQNVKGDDIRFITPKEAGDMLGCKDDVIKSMQDAGYLSLCFKPSVPKPGKEENQKRHRLVILSEVLELQKKMVVRAAKKKK